MTNISSDGVPFILLAIFFLYGAGLALWERDWPELAIRGTIALMLATFTLLGYANELRLIHEPTVRILFWCGLLTFSIVLAALRFWKWAENLRWARSPSGRSSRFGRRPREDPAVPLLGEVAGYRALDEIQAQRADPAAIGEQDSFCPVIGDGRPDHAHGPARLQPATLKARPRRNSSASRVMSLALSWWR
jgi:hypothetical protein